MGTDIAAQLEQVLNRLMLPSGRGPLCAPVISAAPPGIDEQTWPVLHTVGRIGPVPSARLADEIGIDRSGASRHASRLEALGLLRRGDDPGDGRASLLSLTAEGRRVLDELNGVLADHLHEMLRSWPRGEAEVLVDGLTRLLAYHRGGADPAVESAAAGARARPEPPERPAARA